MLTFAYKQLSTECIGKAFLSYLRHEDKSKDMDNGKHSWLTESFMSLKVLVAAEVFYTI